MIGLDNEIPLGYDDYEAMSQLPIAIEHDDEEPDDLALMLAAHGVIQECSSALMSADRRSQARSDECSLVSDAIRTSQPTTDEEIPTPSSTLENPKRKRSRRRSIGNIAIGLITALLACWFAWCGIIAWQKDTQASSLQPQVSYQTIDIEKLKKGDTVIAMNPETGEVAAKKVLQTFERVADHLQIVTFENSDETWQTIETTDEHPFWMKSKRMWKTAEKLDIGDDVTGPSGEVQIVVDNFREEYPEGITVYNFEVEDWHTYFVLANGSRAPPVLVHNSTCEAGARNSVNGRKIVNSDLAGTTRQTAGGPVRFDANGFPDFAPYSVRTVRVKGLTGKMTVDIPKAMEATGMRNYDSTKYVWHHHQDGKSMMLVPRSVHSVRNGGIGHTGGRAVIKHNLENPDDLLIFPSPAEL